MFCNILHHSFAAIVALSLFTSVESRGDETTPPPRPAFPTLQPKADWAKEGNSVFEHADLLAARQAAQKSREPLLVFLTSEHCHFCVKMVNETYAHPQLAPLFHQLFETVSIDAERDPQLMAKLGVRMLPTTLVVTPEGKVIGRLDGFVPAEKIATHLNPVLQDYYAPTKSPVSRESRVTKEEPRRAKAAPKAE